MDWSDDSDEPPPFPVTLLLGANGTHQRLIESGLPNTDNGILIQKMLQGSDLETHARISKNSTLSRQDMKILKETCYWFLFDFLHPDF